MKSLIQSTNKLQSDIDRVNLGNDPRLLNYSTSTLEECRRQLERQKKVFVDLKSGASKEQKP
jgi:hypothetical protein